jgi:hypothetical protein
VRFGKLHFGSITIDGVTYKHDVIIDRGRVVKRKKKPSKKFREEFGHTPGINRGETALKVPAPRNRYRKLWIASDNGRHKARGTTAKN